MFLDRRFCSSARYTWQPGPRNIYYLGISTVLHVPRREKVSGYRLGLLRSVVSHTQDDAELLSLPSFLASWCQREGDDTR